jgi:hypothetical protein
MTKVLNQAIRDVYGHETSVASSSSRALRRQISATALSCPRPVLPFALLIEDKEQLERKH